MRREVFTLLREAAVIALRGDQKRSFFLGAIGIRKDGAIVAANNGGSNIPTPPAHAEARLLRKLGNGAYVYVARVTKGGSLALAKPCRGCTQGLRNKGVKRVYYSISDDEFGVMDLNV